MDFIFVLFIFTSAFLNFNSATNWAQIQPLKQNAAILNKIPWESDRIFGGVEADRGEFPFMAALILDDVALCGGTIISSTTVLTGAQCLIGFQSCVVHLGLHNLTDDGETGRIIVKASKTIPHEDFSQINLDNDVGVVKLPFSVEASNISPVNLPSRSFVEGNSFEGYTSRIFGWGLMPGATNFSDILQTTESIVINNAECQDLFPFVPYVTPLKICLDNVGASGACVGDAGGPAVVQRPEDGKFVQIGIISFSAGKCGYSLPVIMTRLPLFLDWIEANSGVLIQD